MPDEITIKDIWNEQKAMRVELLNEIKEIRQHFTAFEAGRLSTAEKTIIEQGSKIRELLNQQTNSDGNVAKMHEENQKKIDDLKDEYETSINKLQFKMAYAAGALAVVIFIAPFIIKYLFKVG